MRSRPALARNVIALGAVSFLTDVSSEMIYPLLPLFLTGVLGASAIALGAIEGAAETTASLLKLGSGWWSDRARRRRPLVVLGYTLAAVARPLVAVAQSTAQVFAVRITDRVGKGIRSAPRDALIADSVDPATRGRAFGFQRAADHAGAVLGPAIAFVLLQWAGLEMRPVFWLAAIPGMLAVMVLLIYVREAPSSAMDGEASRPRSDAPAAKTLMPGYIAREVPSAASTIPLPLRFWGYLGVVLLFTLGNSTDAFLLVRAVDLGVPIELVPILWATLHVVKSAASTHGGILSDRVGRVPALVAGWSAYALVYAGFGVAGRPWHAWALFALYGIFYALTEGPERALVSDLVPADRRGSAFGWFHLTIGLGALPASLLFGVVWERFAPAAAFGLGAALALGAALVLPFVLRVGQGPERQQHRLPGLE